MGGSADVVTLIGQIHLVILSCKTGYGDTFTRLHRRNLRRRSRPRRPRHNLGVA